MLSWPKNPWFRLAIAAAMTFFLIALTLTVHRYYTFYASFDQGIFNQVYWNSLHGRFFQSSLSSSLSTNVVHSGEFTDVSYHRLGQHFTPALLIWLPIYALFPNAITLTVLQVTLVTAAGVVLYILARQYLQPPLAAMIVVSFYSANAIIGPTLSNFADNCQMPLFMFTLLLAMEKRWWPLFCLMAVCVLAVREDGGVSLFGVGIYMTLSKRYPKLGLGVSMLSFIYILGLTNIIMPLFSEDVSRRFTLERFGHLIGSAETTEQATTLDLLWALISQPGKVLIKLVTPVGSKILYLLGQWLPFGLIPVAAPAAWAIAGFPLIAIFLQQGQTALSINIRYAMTVVPGICYGMILWWSNRQELRTAPMGDLLLRGLTQISLWVAPVTVVKMVFEELINSLKNRTQLFTISIQKFWTICLSLSIILCLTANPNRTLSFIIPDSINPWVYVSLPQRWQHSAVIHSFLPEIPPDASVSATTYIVPHLSSRREILRFPALELRNDRARVVQTEYAIADLWQLEQYQPAFKHDRALLESMLSVIENIHKTGLYGIVRFTDGVILLHRGQTSDPEAVTAWENYRDKITALLVK
jgi:uncharacterized membrane protein